MLRRDLSSRVPYYVEPDAVSSQSCTSPQCGASYDDKSRCVLKPNATMILRPTWTPRASRDYSIRSKHLPPNNERFFTYISMEMGNLQFWREGRVFEQIYAYRVFGGFARAIHTRFLKIIKTVNNSVKIFVNTCKCLYISVLCNLK